MYRMRHAFAMAVGIGLLQGMPACCLAANIESDHGSIERMVRDWARDWDRGDIERYLAHYAEDFRPAGGLSRMQWDRQRRQRFRANGPHDVMLRNLEIADRGNLVEASFTQQYLDMSLISTARKHLTLVRQEGRWKIREERVEKERALRR